MNQFVREWRAEAMADGDPVEPLPDGVFFISSRSLENPCFIVARGGEDVPVYIYQHTSDPDVPKGVEVLHGSVWGWLTEFVRDAAFHVGLQCGDVHARRG